MRVSVGCFYQGICDAEYAAMVMAEYNDAKVIATCVCCGFHQEIKTVADKCNKCGLIGNWK